VILRFWDWEATTAKRMKMDIGHAADVMESATEL